MVVWEKLHTIREKLIITFKADQKSLPGKLISPQILKNILIDRNNTEKGLISLHRTQRDSFGKSTLLERRGLIKKEGINAFWKLNS